MVNSNNAYLGDGVYASHDGYQIWLAANNHENKVIALDPDVLISLCEFAEKHNMTIKNNDYNLRYTKAAEIVDMIATGSMMDSKFDRYAYIHKILSL